MASLSQSNSYSSAQAQQDASNAYKYEDPTAYQIPSGYPANQFEVPLPVSRPESDNQPKDASKTQGQGASEPKVRLRKACDSCSVRKVKVRTPEQETKVTGLQMNTVRREWSSVQVMRGA
jgi:hypothetical protein